MVGRVGVPAGIGLFRCGRPVICDESLLVYLGLAQFVAGVLVLSYWTIALEQFGCAGSVGSRSLRPRSRSRSGELEWRRVGLACRSFTPHPASTPPLRSQSVSSLWPLGARILARDAYPLCAVALAANTVVTMLLAYTWRRAELTYAAVFHFVAATYLILFSVGQNDPRMAFVLGLVAVIEAIVFWTIGFVCQRTRTCLDQGLCLAARSLGDRADRGGRSSLRSFAPGAGAGGDFVLAHGQEPASRRMAVWDGRSPWGPLVISPGCPRFRESV